MNDSQLWLLLVLPVLGIVASIISMVRERRLGRLRLDPLLDGDTPEWDEEQS